MPASSLRLAAFACLVLTGASASAETPATVIEGNAISGVRNTRYCEIIPVLREGLHLKATVYNTLGLNARGRQLARRRCDEDDPAALDYVEDPAR